MATTRTESRRYYYTSQESFEQSLDVYKPVSGETNSTKDLPLVVLVVGSAWLGHRSIIYTGTSWWNSSGPRTFAKQGCVTVCIRHRGSFPRFCTSGWSGVLWLLSVLSVLLVVATTMYMYPQEIDWKNKHVMLITSVIATVTIGSLLLALGAQGAADFDDMVHDVADALCWVQRHKDSEILQHPYKTSSSHSFKEEKKQDSSHRSDSSQKTLVFGGYSSGGHVAATLLQRPHLFTQKGLPPPDEFCRAALFISGVLAVRPPVTSTTSNDDVNRDSAWCTDLVTTVVFGKTGAATLPSPLHGIHKQPSVPHLLIGCKHEVFGLNWMDVFFCSRQFCNGLEKRKVPAKLVQVQSDHWNILGSNALSNVLREELEWIMTMAR